MNGRPLLVQDGLRHLAAVLSAAGIADPAREARLLLAHALSVDPGRMTLLARDPLTGVALAAALDLAARRARGEPASHLLGRREFFGRPFKVDARVLDPRPETECLVIESLRAPFETVLDLGTGSGCILLTLLAERPGTRGTGSDLSPEALDVACENARALGLDDRAQLIRADWYDGIDRRFDLIVSNPPYIAAAEMKRLDPGLAFEPRAALTDEGDGLAAYRAIAAGAVRHLAPGGRLAVEIGPTQAAEVQRLFAAAGLKDIACHPDLDGRDRVISASWPG